MKKISIIIPIYKAENYINQCIESIINQTYKNFELILVDDGSPDNCPKICDEFKERDSRIIVIHQKNQGVSSARNAGIEIATGDYVTFIDSDDTFDLNYIDRMVDEISDDCDMLVSGFKKVGVKKQSLVIPKKKKYVEISDFLVDAYCNNFFNSVWNKFYKRTILKNCRFNLTLKFGEDFQFNIDVLKECKKIKTASIVGYNYFINANQNSLSKTEIFVRKLDNYYNQINQITNILTNDNKNINDIYGIFTKMLFCELRGMIKSKTIRKQEKLKLIEEVKNESNFIKYVNNAVVKSFKMKIVKRIMQIRSIKLFYYICRLI